MSKMINPISKNSNNKFTTRNSKQDIFSKFSKVSKLKAEEKQVADENKIEEIKK